MDDEDKIMTVASHPSIPSSSDIDLDGSSSSRKIHAEDSYKALQRQASTSLQQLNDELVIPRKDEPIEYDPQLQQYPLDTEVPELLQQIDALIKTKVSSEIPPLTTPIHRKFILISLALEPDLEQFRQIDDLPVYIKPASLKPSADELNYPLSLQPFNQPENMLFPCNAYVDSMQWLEYIEILNLSLNDKQKSILYNALDHHFKSLIENGYTWAYSFSIALDLYSLLTAHKVLNALLKMETFFSLNIVVEELTTNIIPLWKSIVGRFADSEEIDDRFNYCPATHSTIGPNSMLSSLTTFLSAELNFGCTKEKIDFLKKPSNPGSRLPSLLSGCNLFFKQLSSSPTSIPSPLEPPLPAVINNSLS